MSNLFDYDLPPLNQESFITQLTHKNVEIKTIISNTLSTPQTFEQECDEWISVLQGCAKIEMDGIIHKLTKGDSLFIKAGQKHTLLKTKKVVVWLAVYMWDEN